MMHSERAMPIILFRKLVSGILILLISISIGVEPTEAASNSQNDTLQLGSRNLATTFEAPVFPDTETFGATYSAIEEQTIQATQDTYIDVSAPDQAFGDLPELHIRKYQTSGLVGKIALLHFDLRQLTDQDITSARLKFQILDSLPVSDLREKDSKGTFNIKSITLMPYTGWNEGTVTFNDMKTPNARQHIQPYAYETTHVFVPALTGANGAQVGADRVVTIELTEPLKPLAGHEFVIVLEDQKGWDFDIYSKEDSAHLAPSLEIAYTPIANPIWALPAVLFTPNDLDLSNILHNPLTGLHKWRGQEKNPNFVDTKEAYNRWTWDKFETSQGVYDFSALEQDIQRAVDNGQKYGFRVRTMEADGNRMPDYMQPYTQSCTGYNNVPDFDHPFVIERARALIEALAQQYNGDPRIAWVDIGMYGRFGEWVSTCDQPSRAIQETYVDMFTDTFTKTQLVIKIDQPYAVRYALQKPPNAVGQLVGLRFDGVGQTGSWPRSMMLSRLAQSDIEAYRLMAKRWEYAPTVTELDNPDRTYAGEVYEIAEADAWAYHIASSSNGNTFNWDELNGTEQQQFTIAGNTFGYKYQLNELGFTTELKPGAEVGVFSRWSNFGTTPTYEPWEVVVELRGAGGDTYRLSLPIDLRKVLPTNHHITQVDTPREFTNNVLLPANILPGDYTVHLIIRDTRTEFPRNPMKLYIGGLQPDGSYQLGSVSVSGAVSSTPTPTVQPTVEPTSESIQEPTATPPVDSTTLGIDGPASVGVGATFSVGVKAHNVTGDGIYGVQLELNYDPSLISASNLQVNPNLPFVVFNSADNTVGKIRLVASEQGNVSGLTGDVTLLSFDATAAGTSGTASFNFENEKLSDPQAQGLEFVSQDFTVSIEEVATPEPTQEPTSEPTLEPTPEPTQEPTSEPTQEPTLEPTPEPTQEPTSEPTLEPTPEPTIAPTLEPTLEPTPVPTQEPTLEPTIEPTLEPTQEPTPEPTQVPTQEPTSEPTSEPTQEPSVSVIFGQIILAGRTGNDWSDATVVIDDNGQNGSTDKDGNFTIANVTYGVYNSVTVDAPGYLPAVCSQPAVQSTETALDTIALLSGDINDDSLVDIVDATAVGAGFGQTGVALIADINRDQILDIFDIVLVSVNYGEAGPSTWNCMAN